MRRSSVSLLPRSTASNTSPASQAEPMMRPSRYSISRLLGMVGLRLKYFRYDREMIS